MAGAVAANVSERAAAPKIPSLDIALLQNYMEQTAAATDRSGTWRQSPTCDGASGVPVSEGTNAGRVVKKRPRARRKIRGDFVSRAADIGILPIT
jgi:hypothetical protein